MRIRMLYCFLLNQSSGLPKPGNDLSVGFKYELAIEKFDLISETASVIYRRIDIQSI